MLNIIGKDVIPWHISISSKLFGLTTVNELAPALISQTTYSGNYYTSNLKFTYLMEGDEDIYTCKVMIPETSKAASVNLDILPV